MMIRETVLEYIFAMEHNELDGERGYCVMEVHK